MKRNLKWHGPIKRKEDGKMATEILDRKTERGRRKGRPKEKWKDGAEKFPRSRTETRGYLG